MLGRERRKARLPQPRVVSEAVSRSEGGNGKPGQPPAGMLPGSQPSLARWDRLEGQNSPAAQNPHLCKENEVKNSLNASIIERKVSIQRGYHRAKRSSSAGKAEGTRRLSAAQTHKTRPKPSSEGKDEHSYGKLAWKSPW